MKNRFLQMGLCGAMLVAANANLQAQKKNDFGNPSLTHYFNDAKTRYIGLSGYAELWARYTQLNPGSLVNSEQRDNVSDLSLRRVRVKMTYQPTEKLLFVLQGGSTNTNVISKSNPALSCWMLMVSISLMTT